MRPLRFASSFLVLVVFALALTGCGVDSQPALSGGTATGVAAISGRVFGGQQPVSGAVISLYAAGSAGNGLGSTSLLQTAVLTDGAGGFNITGDYQCPSGATQVYLLARGGNPGLPVGTSNPALVLMAALGDCGALSAATTVQINEVTTAASAWGLAQFMSPGANVGATATNAAGLRNAFLATGNLVNLATGLAPGATLPAGATTETAKLYTLANVLAGCVNSNGGTGCVPLFAAATYGLNVPTNTLDAALAVVAHPASNVAAVFNAAPAQGVFQSSLAQAPNDWTMSITIAGGGMNEPTGVAADSTGSMWAANFMSPVGSKFTNLGQAVAATGFPGAGLNESYAVTVDPSDNAWITNQQTAYYVNGGNGSVTKLASNGADLSNGGFASGGVYYPEAIAADSNGSIWVADYGDSSVSLLGPSGAGISPANGYAYLALNFPTGVALDGNHNAWLAQSSGAVRVTPTGVVTTFPCCNQLDGVAVDQAGYVWLADYSSGALVEMNPTSGAVLRTVTGGGLYTPKTVAVDGGGTLWVSNFYGMSFSSVSGSASAQPGTVLSPAKGFGVDAGLLGVYGLALDASGNLWVSNFYSNTLTEFLGLAVPIRTPLVGPPAAP